MAGWSREELESAFQHYQDTVARAGATGDWDLFAELFAPDAVYIEHAYGTFRGREAIRAWIRKTMGTFPGNCMPAFPIGWSVLDPDRGWVVCEIRNVMIDPGDGAPHEAVNFTKLVYAGENLWASEEDVYNPAHFATLVVNWARVADAHDTLPEEGRVWLDRAMPGWDRPAA